MAKKTPAPKAKSVSKKPAAKPLAKKKAMPAPKKMAAKKPAPAKAMPKKAPVAKVKKLLPKKMAAPAVKPEAKKKLVGAKAEPMVEKAKKPEKALQAKTGKVEAASEAVDGADAADAEEGEVILTDAEGRRYCRVKECDQVATVDGYCRYHYLLFWKKIQVRKKILSEGKLERYVEELTARYPDKYLEVLRKDLRSEKDFTSAIQELEIDDTSAEGEFEDEAQNYLDEVRGMSSETPAREDDEF